MDCVSQRTQLGGCAQEAEDGSSSVLIARDRSVEVVTPRLKVVNETSGIRQGRDRLQVGERARNQLQRFDAGVIGVSEQLAQRLVQGLGRLLADIHGRNEAQDQVLN